jgi:hypothetical protein
MNVVVPIKSIFDGDSMINNNFQPVLSISLGIFLNGSGIYFNCLNTRFEYI